MLKVFNNSKISQDVINALNVKPLFLKRTNHVVKFNSNYSEIVVDRDFEADNPYGASYVSYRRFERLDWASSLYCVKHFKQGIIHNQNGPAIKLYNKSICYRCCYYINGKIHNPIGPAIASLNFGGYDFASRFFIHDKEMSVSQFVERLEGLRKHSS